mgnify:CR=1 FL=1
MHDGQQDRPNRRKDRPEIGNVVEDECGVCAGDNTECADCNGDPNGDALTVNIVYGPDEGSAVIEGVNVTYTPNNNFFGIDEFGYTVTDGIWTSDIAAVTIEVVGVNDAPTATGFDIIVTVGGAVDLDPYLDDLDGDPLTIVSIPSINAPNLTTAFGGSLELGESGEYTYSPPPFDTATDFLLFKADDGVAQSAMAFGTFILDESGRDWRDRMVPPTAFDDTAVLAEDNTQEISFNAFDPFFSIDLINESINII